LSKVSKQVLERNQDKILEAVQQRLEDPSITKIVIHKIVADANLFQGRITLGRIKKLLAEGIVHEY
jgi:ribosome-binding factor A